MQSNVNSIINWSQSRGNLYVVGVREDGTMQMFWREGDNATWIPSEVFGSSVPADAHPVMIQDFWRTDSEKDAGGFQLLVAVGGHIEHWQRINTDIATNPPAAGDGAGQWGKVATFGSGVKNVWSLIHGSFNSKMHAAVEKADGQMVWYEYDGSWH